MGAGVDPLEFADTDFVVNGSGAELEAAYKIAATGVRKIIPPGRGGTLRCGANYY